MALTEEQITAKNFKKFYELIKPYLNGGAHSGFTPVGSIIAVMGKTAPQNYLICDGTEYNIADYLELASYFNTQFNAINYFGGDGVTTFKVPDLRGEFLRGTGTNSHTNQGDGAEVGTHQDGTEHTWISGVSNIAVGDHDIKNDTAYNADSESLEIKGRTVTGSVTTGTYPSYYTSRPTNTSVLYCIAYKNIFADVANALDVQDGLTLNGNKLSADIMPQTDMSEIIDPLPGITPKWHTWSTEEQAIGTWIDGKTVYEKTIDCGAGPNSTEKAVAHGISNLDKIIDFRGFEYTTNYFGPIPMVDISTSGTTNYQLGVKATNTNLILCTRYNASSVNVYITIQYTKS